MKYNIVVSVFFNKIADGKLKFELGKSFGESYYMKACVV